MKNKVLWILLGGIVLLGLVFLLLNFRLAVGNTQSNKLIVTSELGKNMPVSMRRNGKISMVLVGEGPLVKELQKALKEKIDKTGMGKIELVQELEPAYQNPVLVVKLVRPGLIWTPFFSMSQFSIHAGYSSNGDSTFMEVVEETHTSISTPDSVIMYAEFEVNDRSVGLISRPGYQYFLADYLAQEIVAGLEDLYSG